MTVFFVKLLASLIITFVTTCVLGIVTTGNDRAQYLLSIAAAMQGAAFVALGITLIWVAFP